MHLFFEAIYYFIKLLMRISMLFTREKVNYLMISQDIMSQLSIERICRIFHVLPSLVVSIVLGIKVLPDYWPYYAAQLDKNGIIVSVAIFIIFIPVAIVNGIVIDKVLSRVNTKYSAYKNGLSNN